MATRAAPAAGGASASFEFSQAPSAVPHKRQPYRGDAVAGPQTQNIMFDRRVYRGNTYAAKVLTPAAQQEAERLEREAADKRARRAVARKRRAEEEARPRTPEAVEGRSHWGTQTAEFLEELTDRPVEVQVGVQTDAFADRPPTPPYVPPPRGTDQGTQVEAGELFDFDREVEPLLEVLVGKTLEQGLLEVLEEEELAAIRAHQQEFEALRAAELVRVQRLEEEERRRTEERSRRLEQARARAQQQRAVREKVAAAAFARRYVQTVRASVMGRLVDRGFFFDPLAKEVETAVLPEVTEGALAAARRVQTARQLADALIKAALHKGEARRQAEADRLAAERAEAARLAREEEERRAAEAAAAAQRKAEEEAEAKRKAEAGEDEEDEDEEDEG
ncbi:hypothetical protein FNF28_01721 [Cafeteria roenbergensis]|uniref:Radial spoke protein 3 n=1 Tax=Cafeteria roenbergensis TaxID=33653 RepID=A0A5A8E1V9_CAFRO|nr:hypothetical protein FNF28_01721 [Cafeteria roenbergensis]